MGPRVLVRTPRSPMRSQPSLSDPNLRSLFERRFTSPDGLSAWASASGIEPLLADPAMLAMRALPDDVVDQLAEPLRRSATTIEELAAPTTSELKEFRDRLGDRLLAVAQRESRRYLDEKALLELGIATSLEERAARWESARLDNPAVSRFVARLHGSWKQAEPQRAGRRAELIRWRFLDEPPSLVAEVAIPERELFLPPLRQTVVVPLDGEEPSCGCSTPRCAHVAPAVEAIFAALVDPQGTLEAELAEVLSAPTWNRSLRKIDAALGRIAGREQGAEERGGRLSWKIKPQLGKLPELIPVRQRRLKNGRLSAGSAISLQFREPPLDGSESDQDLRALRLLQILGNGWFPEAVREQLTKQALRELCGHPFLYRANTMEPVELKLLPLSLELFHEDDGSVQMAPSAKGQRIPLEPLLEQIRSPRFDGIAILYDERLHRCLLLEVDRQRRELVLALGTMQPSFPPEAAGPLLERAAKISELVPVRMPESLLGDEVERTNHQLVRVEPIGPSSLRVRLLARPAPGGAPVIPGEGVEKAPGTIDEGRVYVVRDHLAERRLAETLRRRLDLEDEAAEAWTWVLEGDEALDFILRLRDFPENGDIQIEWSGEKRRITSMAQAKNVRVELKQQRDWLGLSGTLEIEGAQVDLIEALDAARRGARFVKATADTWIALAEDLRRRLAQVADQSFSGRGGLELSLASAFALDALFDEGSELQAAAELRGMLERIRASATLDFEVPAGIRGELRPYQVEGFRWLARLASWGGGGCLADDMGLGKTLQTLALLVHRMEGGPALVVAPTSVVGNWVREAERFAPDLRPIVLGSRSEADRAEALEKLGPRDMLVVSYSFLARDRERLSGIRFGTLILDEAQAIKNPQTERAKAARAMQAEVRFALTGTPLENHVGDLWSLFRVTVPGLLGSWEQFRHRFGLPIERDGSAERREALSRTLRPFLLRRTKKEVAAELPARTELNELVELSRAERELYEQARIAAVARVKGLAGTLPPEQTRFEILAAITRLRLAACHPKLYDPDATVASSKLARVVELLLELREEGHRALVFSQFTKHLALVREAVEKAGLSALYLDGQTPGGKRQSLVDAFQAGEGDLFLISLKAGGAGLNLTGADFVLHLDPWWNPAVEDQASDRAHRIGQQKPVTVIRLIARLTIEEQILALHSQKRELVSSILTGSDHAGSLDTNALIELIEQAATGEDAEDP